MTDNIEKIVQEAECVAAADEYFKARTWLMDTNDNRRIFEAGFDRAYALLSKLRAPVADERAAFEAWAQKKKMPLARIGEQYDDFWVDHAWNGWQARAAHASAPEQPQGCPADVCQASKADGVLCANDECDRANGVRPASAPVADARFRSNVEQLCAYAEGSKSANIVGTVRRVRAALASAPVAGEAVPSIGVFVKDGKASHPASYGPRLADGFHILYAAPQASDAHGVDHFRDATQMVGASEAVRDALQKLVDMYVLNQGSDHEHITCYTPLPASHLTPKQRAKSETWKAWDDARAALSAQPGKQKKENDS